MNDLTTVKDFPETIRYIRQEVERTNEKQGRLIWLTSLYDMFSYGCMASVGLSMLQFFLSGRTNNIWSFYAVVFWILFIPAVSNLRKYKIKEGHTEDEVEVIRDVLAMLYQKWV